MIITYSISCAHIRQKMEYKTTVEEVTITTTTTMSSKTKTMTSKTIRRRKLNETQIWMWDK